VCFRGCRQHRPEYPSSVVSLLSLCSSRREGAGTLHLRLIVSEGHGHPLVYTINSLRPSVTELGSITKGRPGPLWGCRAESVTEAQPTLWSPAWVERARPFSGSQHGWCEHGRSLVPSTSSASMAVLWFPTRVVRARPFSGSQHGQCEHGRSLVPSTGGAWPGGGALRCCRRKKRRRRTKERREERGLEEERCAAAGERRGGGQRREKKKRREERS